MDYRSTIAQQAAKAFFNDCQDVAIGSHARTIAFFLFTRFCKRFSKFNYLFKKGSLDSALFVTEWAIYIEKMTPRIFKATFDYIYNDSGKQFIDSFPKCSDFIQISKQFKNYDSDHDLAKKINTSVSGCHCEYCINFSNNKKHVKQETIEKMENDIKEIKDIKIQRTLNKIIESMKANVL